MHDVLIIGAGPAGLSAGLWCDDLGLGALVLERNAEVGGQLLWVYNPIFNHLGVRASGGRELRDCFAAHAGEAAFELRTNVEIESVDLRARRVTLAGGGELRAESVVIATGVRRRRLGIPGEEEFAGRGVMESGARDRELFAGQDVCVVGGGDAAVENALMLAEICASVTLVHRGKSFRARREMLERLRAERRVAVLTEARLRRIIGGERVEGVEVEQAGALKPFEITVRGVLVRVGVEPNTELFRGQAETDERGYVVVNSEQETSVRGVFAVGDVSNPAAPTVSGAIGAGATAAKVIAARMNEDRKYS